MKKKVSLKDIAQKVGVSTALVSYVLNNKKQGRINKETVEKIRDAAAKMNYRPNQIAKSLKTNRTDTIGLIVADISNPFSSTLARIIEDEAFRKGFTVIFGSSDENEQKCQNLIDTLLDRQVDGLLILPPAHSESQVIQLQKQGIPFVLVDRYFPGIDANHVCLDNFTAAYKAVEHLIATGRKRIGLIGYNTPLITLQERESGYLAALTDGKIKGNKDWIKKVAINNDPEEIENAAHALLFLDQPVDALLFESNRIAAHALRFINSTSVKVPEELALVGFDETDLFDFFYAPLTYIKQPLVEMGEMAMTLLLENIQQKEKTIQVDLPGELIIRESTLKSKQNK